MERPVVYGRKDELRVLCSLPAPFVVLSGDPGVGKSHLLRAAIQRIREGGPAGGGSVLAAREPVELRHQIGSLQVGLFESLGGAIAEFEDTRSMLRRWGEVLTRATTTVAESRAKGLVAGVGRYVLGIVRARLGDEFADAVAEVTGQLSDSADDQLAARIRAQADSDVLAAFRSLVGQLSDVIGIPIILGLDRGEVLSDDDFRLLLDLVESMPSGLRLFITHSVRSPSDGTRIRRLASLRASAETSPNELVHHLPLEGLSEEPIAEWMNAVGVPLTSPADDLAAVVRVTAGYPLFVDASLALMRRGERLGSLSDRSGFEAHTRANYTSLEAADQKAVMRLAAFSEPPDESLLVTVLGMDLDDWAVRERRLVEARVFVTRVNGANWFHELGRRAIWDVVLTDRQRTQSARRALRALAPAVDAGGTVDVPREDQGDGVEPAILPQGDSPARERHWTLQRCVDFAELLSYDPEFAAEHANTQAIIGLSRDELALLATLLELSDGPDHTFLEMRVVLKHARDRFATHGPQANTLQHLQDKGLIVIAENEQNAVLCVMWGSNVARLAAIGRMATELNRIPLESLASSVFDVALRPQLGTFREGQFGVGSPSLERLSGMLRDLEWDVDGTTRTRRHRPGLLIRPRLGDLDLYAAINFENAADRNRALDVLGRRYSRSATGVGTHEYAVVDESWASTDDQTSDDAAELFGEVLEMGVILPWPQPVKFPPYRFADAVRLASGEDYRRFTRISSRSILPKPSDFAQRMEMWARAMSIIRERAQPLERQLLDIDRPVGLAYAHSDGTFLVAEVRGRGGVFRLEANGRIAGNHALADIESELQLGPRESLGRVTWGGTGDLNNPLPEIVHQLAKRIDSFNRAQGLYCRDLEVRMEDEWLRARFQEVHDQRLADATSFVGSGLIPSRDETLSRSAFVVIAERDGSEGERLAGFAGSFWSLSVPADDNTVNVRIIDERAARSFTSQLRRWHDHEITSADVFRAYFPIPRLSAEYEDRGYAHSALTYGVAEMLGHQHVYIPSQMR